jgi:UDP-N-acetylglucosamine 1-carboxyvinyltransferase
LHILGLTNLSANVEIGNEQIKVTADGLMGTYFLLKYPSVGATENFLIAACHAKGTSILENAAKEPEIVDLAGFLSSMGADIRGAGTNRITINGVEELHGVEYTIIPDRIETGTFLVAAAVTNGSILLKNANSFLLENVIMKLQSAGVDIKVTDEGINVTSQDKLRPLDIITEVYPGFPTDMQPIMFPLLSMADGESSIKETIFDGRFAHVPEFEKMGAKIRIAGDTCFISGASRLRGAEVRALDLRSGGALVLAGLSAEGTTSIKGISQIFRGYENIVAKLKNVGAIIDIVTP